MAPIDFMSCSQLPGIKISPLVTMHKLQIRFVLMTQIVINVRYDAASCIMIWHVAYVVHVLSLRLRLLGLMGPVALILCLQCNTGMTLHPALSLAGTMIDHRACRRLDIEPRCSGTSVLKTFKRDSGHGPMLVSRNGIEQ
jgi:hypothetical protein